MKYIASKVGFVAEVDKDCGPHDSGAGADDYDRLCLSSLCLYGSIVARSSSPRLRNADGFLGSRFLGFRRTMAVCRLISTT